MSFHNRLSIIVAIAMMSAPLEFGSAAMASGEPEHVLSASELKAFVGTEIDLGFGNKMRFCRKSGAWSNRPQANWRATVSPESGQISYRYSVATIEGDAIVFRGDNNPEHVFGSGQIIRSADGGLKFQSPNGVVAPVQRTIRISC